MSLQPSPRHRGLDILRAVAVLLVLGRHIDIESRLPSFLALPVALWTKSGWAGVDLFFVLSGFLVSGLLFGEYQRHGRVDVKRFLIRRALKLYPPFYLFLLFSVLIGLVLGDMPPLASFAREVFFLQNYGGGVWTHTWSLAVEEHFYILLSLAVAVALRRTEPGDNARNPFGWIPLGFALTAALALGSRIALNVRTDPDYQQYLIPSHLRIDSLFFGVLLSYLHHFHQPSLRTWLARHRWPLVALTTVLLALPLMIPIASFGMRTLGLTGLYLGFGMVILWSTYASARWPSALEPVRSGLAAIGVASYSTYLWHVAVGRLAIPALERIAGVRFSGALALVIYVAGSLALGQLLTLLIEGPSLRLRDRMFPSRQRAALRVENGDKHPGALETSLVVIA